jgi:hypothetical protein
MREGTEHRSSGPNRVPRDQSLIHGAFIAVSVLKTIFLFGKSKDRNIRNGADAQPPELRAAVEGIR